MNLDSPLTYHKPQEKVQDIIEKQKVNPLQTQNNDIQPDLPEQEETNKFSKDVM